MSNAKAVASMVMLGLATAGIGAVMLPTRAVAADAEGTVDCKLVRMALPPELANWSHRTPARAAGTKAGLGKAMLVEGRAVDALLMPTPGVRFSATPERAGDSGSFGGMFGFRVASAGTYRIALGSGAWVDVAQGGKARVSTAHGHGRPCTGVTKYVDFQLTPGRYVVQLAASKERLLPVMIVRLP